MIFLLSFEPSSDLMKLAKATPFLSSIHLSAGTSRLVLTRMLILGFDDWILMYRGTMPFASFLSNVNVVDIKYVY